MDSSIYIFGVFATPTLTFSLFWLLETIKTARQNKQANIRALLSISFELDGMGQLLSNETVHKEMWLKRQPMKFNTNIWERYCGEIIVTNDGVTILNEMEIDHPAAKMIVEIAKTQESEVGGGTTTVVMLAGKLLENAEKLLDKKVHPTVIVKGYKIAAEKALEYLDELKKICDKNNLLKKTIFAK